MITVLTGTQNIPFERLINQIVDFISTENNTDFFIQSGPIDIDTSIGNVEFVNFCSQNQLDFYLEKSSYVVTHAGTGSIIGSLQKNTKVIVMPRLKKYGEHNDDHQVELAERFEKEGHIIYWRENEPFINVLERAKIFIPVPYRSTFKDFKNSILDDISRLMNE